VVVAAVVPQEGVAAAVAAAAGDRP